MNPLQTTIPSHSPIHWPSSFSLFFFDTQGQRWNRLDTQSTFQGCCRAREELRQGLRRNHLLPPQRSAVCSPPLSCCQACLHLGLGTRGQYCHCFYSILLGRSTHPWERRLMGQLGACTRLKEGEGDLTPAGGAGSPPPVEVLPVTQPPGSILGEEARGLGPISAPWGWQRGWPLLPTLPPHSPTPYFCQSSP